MRKILIAVLMLAVVAGVVWYAGSGMKSQAVKANGIQPAATEEASTAEPSKESMQQSADNPSDTKTYAMGNPDAPVKIKEFASLSCSHCAEFHTHTLPQVRKELIDTGKVYFEFVHFPLNAPAMDGALVALCLPEERYHQFVTFLFEEQAKWAFDQNYRQILKQNAKLLGASEEKLDACLANEKMKQDIVAEMQDAQQKYNIQSTPSFVINEKETFSGALPFSEFKEKVEANLPQEKTSE